jgi:hypothetical protein
LDRGERARFEERPEIELRFKFYIFSVMQREPSLSYWITRLNGGKPERSRCAEELRAASPIAMEAAAMTAGPTRNLTDGHCKCSKGAALDWQREEEEISNVTQLQDTAAIFFILALF